VSPTGITLLLLCAFAGFAWLAARKLVILRHLKPEPRWDAPLSRLKTVLVNGFLQRRMIRGERKPGVMHAVIFAGFLILLFRKLELIAIGYDEGATWPGIAGLLFAGVKDVVELGVLAACGYALYRRLVQKPRRLERNREALVILSLIVAIMVTDFAFDAFRFARLAAADPVLAAERDRPRVVDIDTSQFTLAENPPKAKGAYHIVHGDAARQCGYCEQVGLYQRPVSSWAKTYEDSAFRWLLGTDGTGLDVPGVHRIRHVHKGRYGDSKTAALVRGGIRRAKEDLQRP
jgi:hypothetical protein